MWSRVFCLTGDLQMAESHSRGPCQHSETVSVAPAFQAADIKVCRNGINAKIYFSEPDFASFLFTQISL